MVTIVSLSQRTQVMETVHAGRRREAKRFARATSKKVMSSKSWTLEMWREKKLAQVRNINTNWVGG